MTDGGARTDYRYVRDLAAGGMGRIELVVRREGGFARAYARKRLLDGGVADGAVRAMLLEEARVAGLLRHANVVPVLDLGEDDEGPFFVMELVDGISVAALVQRLGARLPVQVAVEIARQIAEGIHAAHELVSPEGTPMGIVHRDLTPTNVLVGFDGVVRVTDFGVAKARDRASLTLAGRPKGKLSYMAPEQLRDEELDRRTDLFALGVVLAEMLRGGRLHGDASPKEVARRTLEEPPPDPGEERDDLPPELVALCFELMARRPDDRPRDARVVAMRLGAIHAALRAEEDPIDLGELVRSRFEDARAEGQRTVAEALRDLDATQPAIALPPTPLPPAMPPAMGLADPPTVRDPDPRSYEVTPLLREPPAPVPAPRAPAPRAAAWSALASVLALVVAASALWAATRGPDRSTPHAPEPAAGPARAEPAAPQLAGDAPEQPGLGQPGLEQPGLEQPDPEQPGLEQPGPEQPPSLEQPGPEQPGLEQPAGAPPADDAEEIAGDDGRSRDPRRARRVRRVRRTTERGEGSIPTWTWD